MIITSREIPQADSLVSVVQAIINIGNGAKTDEEIIKNIEALNADRQGRYYRLIGEILGLVNNEHNNASLTPEGDRFFQNPTLGNPYFINAILNMKIFQIVLPFIEIKKSISHKTLVNYLLELNVPIAEATVYRRVSSLLAWLTELNIIVKNGREYLIRDMVSPLSNTFLINDDRFPILPETGNLEEYKNVGVRVNQANQILTIYKDQAKLERANNSHKSLVNIVANRIRQVGGIPKSNQFIDLATTLEQDYIFEMKSTTENNVTSQVRKGISQLYEYRYLENKPNANLILVIENPLTQNDSWLRDYMEIDRNIHLVWDGDGNLYGSENSRQQLGFLNLLGQK